MLGFLLAQVVILAPGLPVLPPAQVLPPVRIAWDRTPCVAPTCSLYPSHWYFYRNGIFTGKYPTTFETPINGDDYFPVFRSTATRSIEVAAANEFVDPASPRVSARAGLALQIPVVVRNPTQVTFMCPDHDQDTGHELDIVNAVTGAVVQTLALGDPPADAQGNVMFAINVQPVQFGTYIVRARSTANGVKSANSPDSDVWERVPGPPSKPVVQ